MKARYSGECSACGAQFPAGAEIWYDGALKRATQCPACAPKPQPVRSVVEVAAAPAPVQLAFAPVDPFTGIVYPQAAPPPPPPPTKQTFVAKRTDTCACGAETAIGARVTWDPTTRKLVGCPACGGGELLEAAVLKAVLTLSEPVEAALAKLTDEQRIVAGWRGGIARLLATAGSGKTATCVTLAGALMVAGIDPKRILLTSFTVKAAGEIRARLVALFGAAGRAVTTGTFHSLVRGWLIEHYTTVGDRVTGARINNPLDGGGKVDLSRYGEAEARRVPQNVSQLARALLSDGSLSPWLPGEAGLGLAQTASDTFADAYLSAIGILRAGLVAPTDAAAIAARFPRVKGLEQFYALFERACCALGVSTFDEWLYLAGRLASNESSGFARRVGPRFSHYVIDEAQDNNLAQLTLALALARASEDNLLLVGDTRQSIFSFRGAEPQFTVDLERHAVPREVTSYFLSANFRSSASIVELGNKLVEGRTWSVGPAAVAKGKNASRSAVESLVVWRPGTPLEEAREVATYAKTVLEAAGTNTRPIAVLGRTNAALGPIEAALLRNKLPYVLSRGTGFFNRREIIAVLAYLRCAFDVNVDEDVVRACCSTPSRFLGRKFAESVMAEVGRGLETMDAMERAAARNTRWRNNADDLLGVLGAVWNAVGVGGGGKSVAAATQRAALAVMRAFEGPEVLKTAADSRLDNLACLPDVAGQFETVQELLDFAAEGAIVPEDRKGACVTLSTIHACVHPDTLTESIKGLRPIRDVEAQGRIATPRGLKPYSGKFTRHGGVALRITTRSGYELIVTPEHGMTTWADGHVRRAARDLNRGNLLRLRLGMTSDAAKAPQLPSATLGDSREVRFRLPRTLTPAAGELFGLMVADGTIFYRGFRLGKWYQSVVDRFVRLTRQLFGAVPTVDHDSRGLPQATISSTFLARWLLQTGGMAPCNKYIPAVVLQAPLHTQAAFLRGLFEDGTVNEANGHIDHVRWENRTPAVVGIVQTMLLRFGIISARRTHDGITSLYIYGRSAQAFAKRIGFVSPEKNLRLKGTYASERMYSAPITEVERAQLLPLMGPADRSNSHTQGSLSRHGLRRLLETRNAAAAFLRERLSWHYEPIRSIHRVKCKTMCLEVPDGHRFLQNGFDGWNSKGLQWDVVVLPRAVSGMFPFVKAETPSEQEEERRIEYVAVTRAAQRLVLSAPASIQGKPTQDAACIGIAETLLRSGGVQRRRLHVVDVDAL